jgi:hypothetical protein
MEILSDDQKMMVSSQEYEKVPYIVEAITHAQKELEKLDTPQAQEDSVPESFEEKKRRHNKKQALKGK